MSIMLWKASAAGPMGTVLKLSRSSPRAPLRRSWVLAE
jgi:hypothetical protein